MWTQHKNAKSQRTQVYVDCICGAICSISALIGIFYFSRPENPLYMYFFTGGLIFWLGYLALSIFIVGLGILTYIREKKSQPNEKSGKKLKVPIV
ncbi:MAG: hypothetical protein ACFE9R_03845 [Candidatus Hermodarchaeota archaeon]